MKKIYKGALIAALLITMLTTLFLPVFSIMDHAISLADFVYSVLRDTSNSLAELLQNQYTDYAIGVIILCVLFVVVLCLVIKIDSIIAYYIAIVWEIVQITAFSMIYLAAKGEIADGGLIRGFVSNFIHLNVLWVLVAALFHIAVLGVAAVSIYSLKKEQEKQVARDDIQMVPHFDTDYGKKNIQPYSKQHKEIKGIGQIDTVLYGNRSGQQGEESFEGAIKGIKGLYKKKVYILYDRVQVYFLHKSSEVVFSEYRDEKSMIGIYYIKRYREYCLEVYQNNVCFLQSGQPLGLGKRYYLPRGTQIFLDNRENSFLLV